MVDGWMGDDWFHYGAFRLPSLDYILEQEKVRGGKPDPPGCIFSIELRGLTTELGGFNPPVNYF